MLKKKIISLLAALFFIFGAFVLTITPSSAEDPVPIDISLEEDSNGILYANGVPIPPEYEVNSEEINLIMDTYLNNPQNLPELDPEIHALLIKISLTLEEQ